MNSKNILFFHNRHVDKLKKKLINYEKDINNRKRILNQECKYCYYIDVDIMAGQAFTNTTCQSCKKELIFPTTSIDSYCNSCAKKLSICKHCGSDMD